MSSQVNETSYAQIFKKRQQQQKKRFHIQMKKK